MDQATQCNMLREKVLFTCLLALAADSVLALPPGSWTLPPTPNVSKYSRALGPMGPSAMDTISVPYMPKTSPFFPKFVDPKAMISKKTDMLSNLFGGVGPAAYDMTGTKPIMPYSASGSSFDITDPVSAMLSKKREVTPIGKEKAIEGGGMSKRGLFGPFGGGMGPMGPMGSMGPMGMMGPKFGPMGPKFGPMMPFPSPDAMTDFTEASRRKRSPVAEDVDPTAADKSPIATLNLPFSDIPAVTKPAGSETPKENLPGMFGGPFGGPFAGGPYAGGPFAGGPFAGGPYAGGPFAGGPFAGGPFGPAVDPSMMMAKKSAFLDTLFKSFATSTTAAPETVTEVPVPKSTIVPPSYWLPSGAIADPTAYTSKVSDFLNKLFDTLKTNMTKADADVDSVAKVEVARALKPDASSDAATDKKKTSGDSSLVEAKDALTNMILLDLGELKNDMIATMNDLIAYQSSMAASAASAKKPAKPFAAKPFPTLFPKPFASFWPKPTPAPSVDPMMPFKQRMAVISQVFDMLMNLQRNITEAVNNVAAAEAADATGNSEESVKVPTEAPIAEAPSGEGVPSGEARAPFNASSLNDPTVLGNILKKLSTTTVAPEQESNDEQVVDVNDSASPVKEIPPAKNPVLTSRALSKEPMSFWLSYPETAAATAVKRQVDDYLLPYLSDSNNDNDRRQRAVSMQMHQGYQSLPAGSVESVQAGGGSTPGHQGGGIKLLGNPNAYGNLNKWADWMQYHKNEYQEQRENNRHHHNHH